MKEKKASNFKHRTLKTLLVIVIVIAFFIILGILILKIVAPIYYQDFYDKAQCEFEIPELSTGFIPQGFEYRTEDKVFLISGYIYKSDVSRVYIVEPDGRYTKVEIQDTDGSALISHSGGICSLGEFIYIAGCDGKCYVLTAESVMESESGSARIIGSFDTYNDAVFCCVNGDKLYVGEYYHPIKFKTNKEHWLVTPSGDKNNAIVTAFDMEEGSQLGVEKMPVVAYSIRSTVQGMCFTDDNKIVLSSSSVFKGSQLYYYDFEAISKGITGIIAIEDTTIPLYYVDRSNLKQKIEVLPKSEGLAFRDGRVYMLFESASKRFKYGKLLKGDYVYSYDEEIE